MKKWFFAKANRLRWVLNLWPPFLFSGIKITEIAPDYRYCKVILKDWPGTKNANGTQFGGSLFAMTDPIYSLMLMGLLGKRYFVWDKAAHIDFEKPGQGRVYVECRISDTFLAALQENTAHGEKYLPQVVDQIKDKRGQVVATVTRTLYVRLKPAFRPDSNGVWDADDD